MALRIMPLDMRELRRLLPKRRMIPIQIPQPLVDPRVAAPDVADVGLEMLDVDDVEADDGRVEADVCLGDVGAEVEGSGGGGEVLLYAVEGREEGGDGGAVGGFGGCEAGAVDAVVDFRVDPFVGGLDLFLE